MGYNTKTRYSKLFAKIRKKAPSDAEAVSHKLLVRAGYIDQLMAGVFSFLPLGWRVHEKIAEIIREEINKIGGQELFLPALQKKEQWLETKRWETIDPPLFKFKDRHERELALGPTHEEIITDLARRFIESYKDLPLALYQIQNKFRNEMRATGGLLRTREFVMKDLYSFHTDPDDLGAFFTKVKEAYHRIFESCGVEALACQASGGSIGGETTYEFQVPSPSGEDTVLRCSNCSHVFNEEVLEELKAKKCPRCGHKKFQEVSTIEAGHIFNLGTEYSKKMRAVYTDDKGQEKLIWMGCYGIGLGRLMATVVEISHDERGIIWPKNISPYQAHLILLESGREEVRKQAEQAYRKLQSRGMEVLYDDRPDISAGVKFAEADLVGIPVRLVVSQKTGEKIEWKKRNENKEELISLRRVIERLKG